MRVLLFYVFLGLFACSTLQAQNPTIVVSANKGWHRIYETSFGFEPTEKEIIVLLADRFSAIRFDVSRATLKITQATIIFENGTSAALPVNTTPKNAGAKSRVFELPEKDLKIEKIILICSSTDPNKKKKAAIKVWGRKD